MNSMHFRFIPVISFLILLHVSNELHAQQTGFSNNPKAKILSFSNGRFSGELIYEYKADIHVLNLNDQRILFDPGGLYSVIRTKTKLYTSLNIPINPVISINGNTATISGIDYGDKDLSIRETWTLTLLKEDIKLDISRTLSKPILAEQMGFPVIQFAEKDTWEGAYQDYGGLAWFYLFNKPWDSYGVHSSSSRFWNSKTGNGLLVNITSPGNQVAMNYLRSSFQDRMACAVALSKNEMVYRFDPDTKRRRYVRDTALVWAPTLLPAGTTRETITLSGFSFEEQFGRGNLKGIDQQQVSGVLNTIARIGVIDKEHFGGNSWHTPYGPICLHEQYIAQMGLAINDNTYLKGYQQCLDFYRDNAFKPDGRVWPRWAYSNEDAMPNGFTDKGLYEAQWGYLLDSNPDYVTNVSELYDQTGDLKWVKTQQTACERALDWIMKRDSNGNGLVEMMTDSYKEKRGSDWIDIIWAAYENAFVNAKLYHALVLWADIEKQLGDHVKSQMYAAFAQKLKTSFNKPTTQGGFWDEEKKCYVHWLDKDGSVHGNNMVTPVNFMAIAYGICDDENRTKTILDDIEVQMQKENLFFWPLCMYSYAPGEGNDWQFPFPNYENGDIFLSWGAVGVKAYASYKPELALKYVKNVLAQYAKDGLAFQRYGRVKQDGLGDDILSGNSLSVVGLYQAIYGINPLHNRFYLDPHITKDLAGTEVRYRYRDQLLSIALDMNDYQISDGVHRIRASADFGFSSKAGQLQYFRGHADTPSLTVTGSPAGELVLDVRNWMDDAVRFTVDTKGRVPVNLKCSAGHLLPEHNYDLIMNGKKLNTVKSDTNGNISFSFSSNSKPAVIILKGN